MINIFLKNTIDMLYRSDIRVHIPSFNKLELNVEKRTLFLEIEEFANQTRLEENLIFCSMIFFTLIDTKIDIEYPYLEGDSFRRKYLKLPGTNDEEIIIREIYRILKIIRNATIHSRNSIELKDDNNIIIDYTHRVRKRETKFHLSITKYGLELIYTLIILYLDDNNYCYAHKLGLLRTIYDDILLNTSKVSDDFGEQNLSRLSNGIRLKRNVRYLITNPDYIIDASKRILIINRIKFQDYPVDYIIHNENNSYIIPDDILNKKGILEVDEMDKWNLEGDSKIDIKNFPF